MRTDFVVQQRLDAGGIGTACPSWIAAAMRGPSPTVMVEGRVVSVPVEHTA